MARVDKLLPFILRWEGGFVNDPLDNGGATNMGVTIATYELYCRRKGYPRPTVERLKNITTEQVQDILKTLYWDRWKGGDIISQPVANILVDWVWGSGVWGIKIPQRVLGLKEDGVVGPVTLGAINDADPKELFDKIKAERKKFLYGIVERNPTQKRFINGWLNRLNALTFEL